MNITLDEEEMKLSIDDLSNSFMLIEYSTAEYIFLMSEHKSNPVYHGAGQWLVDIPGIMILEDGYSESATLTLISSRSVKYGQIQDEPLRQMLLSDDQETRAIGYGIASVKYASKKLLLNAPKQEGSLYTQK